MTKTDYTTSKPIDFDATIVKVTIYNTKGRSGSNRYIPWTPRTGVSMIMKTTGGRLVQIRRTFHKDSKSPLLSLAKGDKVNCRGWFVAGTKELADGTPLHYMTEGRGAYPVIEKIDETKEGN
jgi:hypothetical protein